MCVFVCVLGTYSGEKLSRRIRNGVCESVSSKFVHHRAHLSPSLRDQSDYIC